MTGVQLIGKKALIAHYQELDAESWALFQGKQFIVGGCGVESLDSWLTSFTETASTATYSLRVYDSDQPPTSSTAGGDYIACLSFKVIDQYEGHGIAGHSNKLMERLGAIEDRLKEREQETDEEPQGDGLNSIIMGWLEDPVKLGQIVGAVRQAMGLATPGAQAIGSTGQVERITDEQDIARLEKALDKLGEKDAKLIDHLDKLAKLADSDPALFQSVISKIDLLC